MMHSGLPLGRRRLARLGATLLAAGAARPLAAQPARPAPRTPPTVLPLPMPCASRPGDVVGLLLEGLGPAAETVVTFGQAFRPGDLPRDATLAARLADGRPLRAQCDVTVRHPDGSARHGVVSLAAPALADGARAGVILARGGGPAAPALDFAAASAGRQAVVELVPAGGGEPWRADLLALARAQREGRPWQSGPLATARRVAIPVPPGAVGGATSLRLVADIAFQADGSLRADVWLRNDVAMRPGGGLAAYTLRVLLDGREALRAEGVRQAQYQAWGRMLGAAPGGRAAPAPPLVRPDAAYLADAGAVARYDLTTGVEEAALERYAQALADPAWAEPLGPRGITRYMPMAGGRADLGPTTMHQAIWLISGDRRAAAYVLGQAEAAGAVPWHFWDPEGGAGGRGGWMDDDRWPLFWTDPRGGQPPRTLLQPVARETGWNADPAHQPDLSFVPYLLTGRRAFLDGLQAQAAWNVISVWPAVRGRNGRAGPNDGVIIVQNRQVRSSAWSIRQVDEAGWITPDDDPNAEYLHRVSAANWEWVRGRIPDWTAAQGEAHGWLPGVWTSTIGPWQQDYFASSAAAAARRGNADARAVLSWMANFLVGRFNAEAKGFARHDGAAFNIAAAPQGVENPAPFRTWAEIGEATRARGQSNGTGWTRSQGEYARLALQSLAALYDVLGLEEARRTYVWLLAEGPPFTAPQTHARIPTLNIVPRGMPRIPERALRCTAAATPRG